MKAIKGKGIYVSAINFSLSHMSSGKFGRNLRENKRKPKDVVHLSFFLCCNLLFPLM
uniref:Uncharacterized protein n=1 Tax=Meloidogyne enterolobii TaxID=390850 RepID=A0A6V7W2M9_MELEN|nr:unnamed protein product [Meloidogyne enterolobii]